jgi:trimeric autotransporter adhesin
MRSTRSFLVLALVPLLCSASLAPAQQPAPGAQSAVPTLVRFSGTLAAGDGPLRATFALYAEASGGEPLWTETQAVAVDAAGRYTVLLGATVAEGIPREMFATGAARWVEVRVDGLEAPPRVLLTSVPYALKAADAETIGGKPLSAFVLAGEKTGVGADGLTYVDTRVLSSGLTAAGSGTAPGPPSPLGGSGAAGGAGSANFIGMFTDATTLGNSVIYQTPAGSIGVNTLAPAAAFHVMAPAAPAAYFDVYNNALGALPVVYRAARGTPFAPSAVQTDDILGGLAVRGYGTSTFSAGRGQVMFKAAENWTDEANGTYLQLTTTPLGSGNWAERMRIDPAGNVGIGTTTPAQKLSVAGTIESTTGGFKFPDGTMQTTAAAGGVTSLTAGSGISITGATSSPIVSIAPGGVVGAMIGSLAVSDGHIAGVAASKIAGSLPVAQVTGAATLAGNTFTSSQTIGTGNLGLPLTTAPSSGVLTLGGQPFLHGYGATPYASTFVGQNAGSFAVSGTGANVGVGPSALAVVTTGYSNTAIGYSSMLATTTGRSNTAVGQHSLSANTTGHSNAAFGAVALRDNTANLNSAFGSTALAKNTSGTYNAAFGAGSLEQNTTGLDNSAFGYGSASANVTGSGISAFGTLALVSNTASETSGFGSLALMANTTGEGNSAFGYAALGGNTIGSSNSAFGNRALEFAATASGNSAFGYHALQLNNGASNTAVGASALAVNTTGNFNTAVGSAALSSSSVAVGNTAVGYNALAANTTGAGNTAVGRDALRANVSGPGNTALGDSALIANTTGDYNVAVGSEALLASVDGVRSTAVGAAALAASRSDSDNTAVGYMALQNNDGGYKNTAIGMWALRANTTGNRNTAAGTDALPANTTGTYVSAFGAEALENNTTGGSNTAVGVGALRANVSGSYSVAVGNGAGATSLGFSNTFLGYVADTDAANATIHNATAVGASARVTQSDSLVLGSSAVSVGIGTSAPNTKLQVVGNIRVGTSGTLGCVQRFDGTAIAGTCSSDARLKADIVPVGDVLGRVAQLQPVRFRWRTDEFPERHLGNTVNVGLIAQQVEQVFPELVSTDDQGYKLVSASELPYLTIAAVKELKAANDSLKTANDALKAQLAALGERLARLEAAHKQANK